LACQKILIKSDQFTFQVEKSNAESVKQVRLSLQSTVFDAKNLAFQAPACYFQRFYYWLIYGTLTKNGRMVIFCK
jgi:hypothetical protein